MLEDLHISMVSKKKLPKEENDVAELLAAKELFNSSDRELTGVVDELLADRIAVSVDIDEIYNPDDPTARLSVVWRDRFDNIVVGRALHEWYNSLGRHFPERVLFWKIDQKFGLELASEVRHKYNLDRLQCLVVAVLWCKESPVPT